MNAEIIQMFPAEKVSLLQGIYQWGIAVIKVIQRIQSPPLTGFFKLISALGTQALYVPLILLVLWLVNEKQGLRFAILIILSAWINSFLKDLFKQPRPFNFDQSLGLAFESSYGAPSGHAQMSLIFWIPMAAWLSSAWAAAKGTLDAQRRKKLLVWTIAVLLILIIAFSRLYLGVHFPTDIFLGWIIAGIILAVWFIAGPFLEKALISAGPRSQNIIAALIALVMNGLYPRDRTLPALFLGLCIGYVLMKKYYPFEAGGEINGKKPGLPVYIFRALTGLISLGVVYLGLRLMLPGEGSLLSSIPLWGRASPLYEISHFILYGALGLWISAGAPRIFQQMKLARDTGNSGKDSTGSGGDAGNRDNKDI